MHSPLAHRLQRIAKCLGHSLRKRCKQKQRGLRIYQFQPNSKVYFVFLSSSNRPATREWARGWWRMSQTCSTNWLDPKNTGEVVNISTLESTYFDVEQMHTTSITSAATLYASASRDEQTPEQTSVSTSRSSATSSGSTSYLAVDNVIIGKGSETQLSVQCNVCAGLCVTARNQALLKRTR